MGFWEWLKSSAFVYVRIENNEERTQIKIPNKIQSAKVIDTKDYKFLDKKETKLLR